MKERVNETMRENDMNRKQTEKEDWKVKTDQSEINQEKGK